MKQRLVASGPVALLLALAAGAFGSCRTANGPASVKDAAASQAPSTPVVSLEGAIGSPAAVVYEKTSLVEASDAGTLKKSYSGRLIVHCTQAGAQPATAQFSCAAASAQAAPAPAFLQIDGDAARAFWDAFASKSIARAGSSEKVFEAEMGDFGCARTGGTYRCTAGAPGSALSAAAAPPEVLSVMGGHSSVAGLVWNALSAPPTVIAGVATKSVSGRIALACRVDGEASCTAARPQPAQFKGTAPAPFLKLDGPAAKALFDALKVTAAKNAKAFNTEAGELSCGRGGNEQYSCTLRGKS